MNKEISNNNFIIASRAYFLQSSTCTRVNNLDYIVINLTPIESWCWSFARGRGLVNGVATFRSACILQTSMYPSLPFHEWSWSVSWCVWFSCETWIPSPRQLLQCWYKRFSLDPMSTSRVRHTQLELKIVCLDRLAIGDAIAHTRVWLGI